MKYIINSDTWMYVCDYFKMCSFFQRQIKKSTLQIVIQWLRESGTLLPGEI